MWDLYRSYWNSPIQAEDDSEYERIELSEEQVSALEEDIKERINRIQHNLKEETR
jgi:hypothetical protein